MRSALHKKFLPPFKGGALDPLMIGLESYWALDELSGTRYDSIGSNDLTDNNTVNYVNDGPRGVNASFVAANTEFFNRAPIAGMDSQMTLSMWIKDNDNVRRGIFEHGILTSVKGWVVETGGVAAGDINMFLDSGYTIYCYTAGSTVPINEWIHIVITYDGTQAVPTDRPHIYVDGVDKSLTFVGVPPANLAVGDILNLGLAVGRYFDGEISRVGMWSRVISAPERLELYNAGRAKSYSDLSPGIKTNLVSYWNLDEVSQVGISGAVTRNDSHGTNHLTDNNTVNSYQTGPEQVVATFASAASERLTHAGVAITSEQAWSAVGWVKVDSTSPNGIVFAIGDLANDLAYIYAGVGVTFYGTGLPTFANQPPKDDKWHMWAIVQSGTTSKSSIDGDTFLTQVNTPNAGSPYAIQINCSAAYGDFKGGPTGIWNRALSQSEVTALFNAGVAKKYSELSAGEKTDLISYWNLTELSGNRADSHGANTLTDNNTVMSVINMPDVADKVCAKFDSTLSENLSRLNFTMPGTFTLAAWIKKTTVGGAVNNNYSYIVGFRNAGVLGPDFFELNFQTTNLGYWVGIGGFIGDKPYTKYYIGDYLTDRWTLIIAWFDGADFHVIPYGTGIDSGVDIGPIAGSIWAGATGKLEIGTYRDAAGLYWDGNIDELAIWSRVLTAPERTRLFNLGKGIFYPAFTP